MDGTTAVITGQEYTEESLKAHMPNCAVVSPAVEHWKKSAMGSLGMLSGFDQFYNGYLTCTLIAKNPVLLFSLFHTLPTFPWRL